MWFKNKNNSEEKNNISFGLRDSYDKRTGYIVVKNDDMNDITGLYRTIRSILNTNLTNESYKIYKVEADVKINSWFGEYYSDVLNIKVINEVTDEEIIDIFDRKRIVIRNCEDFTKCKSLKYWDYFREYFTNNLIGYDFTNNFKDYLFDELILLNNNIVLTDICEEIYDVLDKVKLFYNEKLSKDTCVQLLLNK